MGFIRSAHRSTQRRRTLAATYLAIAGCAVRSAPAQSATSAAIVSGAAHLPEYVTSELAKLQDFSFSYAQPGFYALLEHIKQAGVTGEAEAPLAIERWTDLLERSADYRGRAITISGVIGRNTPWQLLNERFRDIGPVWELQLRNPNQPILCKCILIGDASDLPIGAAVTVTGRFVMNQQYYGESKRLSQAALMIGVGPSVVIQDAAHEHAGISSTPSSALIISIGAGLLIAYLILRRVARPRAIPLEALQTPHPAPFSLSDDLARWAASTDEDPRDEENAGRR